MRSKVFGARYGDTERLGFALPTPGDGVVGNGREAFIGQGLVGDLEILRCTGLLECALEDMRVGVVRTSPSLTLVKRGGRLNLLPPPGHETLLKTETLHSKP